MLEREACIHGGLITETNRYSPRALGIAASHVALWKICAAGTEPFHIAEDDAIFHPHFVGFAANNLAKLGDLDAVFWGFNFDWPIEVEFMQSIGPIVMLFNQNVVRDRFAIYRKSRFQPALAKLISCAGICAYSISPSGARRYLNRCLPIGDAGARLVLRRDKTLDKQRGGCRDVAPPRVAHNLCLFAASGRHFERSEPVDHSLIKVDDRIVF